MNKIYKLVFSKSLGQFIVTSEQAKGRTKSSKLKSAVTGTIAAATVIFSATALADPDITVDQVTGNKIIGSLNTVSGSEQTLIGSKTTVEGTGNNVIASANTHGSIKRNKRIVETFILANGLKGTSVETEAMTAFNALIDLYDRHVKGEISTTEFESILNTPEYIEHREGYVGAVLSLINTNYNPDEVSQVLVNVVKGSENQVVGSFVDVRGHNNVAIGTDVSIHQRNLDSTYSNVDDAIAIGTEAHVSANNGIAIGSGATTTHEGSVAIGAGSQAKGQTLNQAAYLSGGTATGEANFGNRRLTGLAAGATDSDAATVGQLKKLGQTIKLFEKDALITGQNNIASTLGVRGEVTTTTIAPRQAPESINFGSLDLDIATAYLLYNHAYTPVMSAYIPSENLLSLDILDQALATGDYTALENNVELFIQGFEAAAGNIPSNEMLVLQETLAEKVDEFFTLLPTRMDYLIAQEGMTSSAAFAQALSEYYETIPKEYVTQGIGIIQESVINGDQNVAFGYAVNVEGDNNIALGTLTTVTANDGIALGNGASVTVDKGIAIGKDASVSHEGSVAIGAGSVADGTTLATPAYLVTDTADSAPKGEVNFGQRRLTGVAAGANDFDAVNVAQLKVVHNQIADINEQIENLDFGGGEVDLNSSYNVVIGKDITHNIPDTEASASNIIGNKNQATNSSKINVLGSNNTATAATKTNIVGVDNNLNKTDYTTVLGDTNNLNNIGAGFVAGRGNTVTGSTTTQASRINITGLFNEAVYDPASSSTFFSDIDIYGSSNKASRSDTAIVGGGNNIRSELSSTIGYDNKVGLNNNYKSDRALVLGSTNTINGANQTVIGSNLTVSGGSNNSIVNSFGMEDYYAKIANAAKKHGFDEIADAYNELNQHMADQKAGRITQEVLNGYIAEFKQKEQNFDYAAFSPYLAQENVTLNNSIAGWSNQTLAKNVSVNGDFNVDVGTNLYTKGDANTLLGKDIGVTGSNNAAIGSSVFVSDSKNVSALGHDLNVKGNQSTLIGGQLNLKGNLSSIFGFGSTSTGSQNNALGNGLSIEGDKNALFGNNLSVVGQNNTTLGSDTTVDGKRNIAITQSLIRTDTTTQIDESYTTETEVLVRNSSVKGNDVVAMGSGVLVDANQAVAIGAKATVTAVDGVAIGTGASVSHAGSVAIGAGSVANGETLELPAYLVGGTATGEANFGNRRLTGVSAGSSPTDAVNVSQLTNVQQSVDLITGRVDAVENDLITLQEQGSANIQAEINALGDRVTTAEGGISDLKTDVGTVQTDLGAVQADLGDLTDRVGVNEGNITDLQTDVGTVKTDLSDLDTRVGVNEENITELKTDVGNTKTDIGILQTDLGGLDTRVGVNEGNITALDEAFKGHQTVFNYLNDHAVQYSSNEGTPNFNLIELKGENGTIIRNVARAQKDGDAVNFGLLKEYTSALETRIESLEGGNIDLTQIEHIINQNNQTVLDQAKDYADDKAEEAKDYADQKDAETLADAKEYADQKDAETLTDAKEYADQKDAENLELAKGYADGKDAENLELAKDYADGKVEEAKDYADQLVDGLELGVSKEYVDQRDAETLTDAKDYTDQVVRDLELGANTEYLDSQIETAKDHADQKAADAEQNAKDYADQKDALVLDAAKQDATDKANAAEQKANTYTDNRVTESLNLSYAYTDAAKTESFAYTDLKTTQTLNEAKAYADKGDIATLQAAKDYTDERINSLESAFRDSRDEHRAGIASALAIGNMPQPTMGGANMVSMGVGTFQGESAIAVGFSAVTDDQKYVFKFGGSADSRNNVSGAASVGFQWK